MRRRRTAAVALVTFAVLAQLLAASTSSAKTRGAPTLVSRPKISGLPVVGRVLATSRGTWGHGPSRYRYRWLSCNAGGLRCRPIARATGGHYRVRQSDVRRRLRVLVTAGNRKGWTESRSLATHMVAADTAAPSEPSGLATSGVTQTTITLSWTASTDNVDLAGYTVYLDGVSVGTTTETSHAFTSLACGSSHWLAVDAFDAVGNHSARATVDASTVGCSTLPSNTALPLLSGTPQMGQTLSVTNGYWAGTAPMTYSYQWQQCNAAGSACSPIVGAASSSYPIVLTDIGHTLRATVTATNAVGSAAATSLTSALVAAGGDVTPPSQPTGLATSNITATQIRLSWTASTDNVGVTGYTLYRNGTQVATDPASPYTFTGLTCATTYTLAIDAYDAAGNHSTQASTSATTAACPTPPANTALPAVTGTTEVGQTLTVSNGTWSGTAPFTYAYEWQDCNGAGIACTTITGASANTYTLVSGDLGHTIRAKVTASNGGGSASATSNPTGVVNPSSDSTAPTQPTNLATPNANVTATQIRLTWTASTDNVGVTGYTLYRDGTQVTTKTASPYTFTGLTCGTTYTLGVDAYDAAGNHSTQATISKATLTCPVPPSNTGLPSISGTAQVSQTLTVSNGTWSGTSPFTYVYEWQQCNSAGSGCTPIAGATANTYTVAAGDLGHTIRAKVTASNAAGSDNATSNATGVVIAAPPPGTVTVTNNALGDLSTQITSNNVYAGLVDDNPAVKSRFSALALPLVRIHVGDDSGDPAMPEIQQNSWSFSALNKLVNDETSIGQQVLMNIKFAPDWMWTCSSFGQPGSVRDQTFQTYAAYMARLVAYYNVGQMTTETGTVITNPAGTSNHITYWEPWNEPDLSNETPCTPPSGQALTPAQYVTMWNAVTTAMLAVDPTIKLVGPATAGGQFGSSTGAGNEYVTQLMTNGTHLPTVLSFHGYGYWDNSVTDSWIFDGDNTGAGGIPDMLNSATNIHNTYPGYPIWIDEMNVNADWGNDPHGRPWGPFSAAWWAATYIELAPLNVAMLDHYNVVESPQFGLIDYDTGNPYLPYWILKTLNAAFPTGSTRLQASSADTKKVEVMAARRPDGKISVLVTDRQVDPANTHAGLGLAEDVTVSLSGITPTAISVQRVDTNTSVTAGPTTTALTPSTSVSLHFPGYGLAVLTITP